ncbi:MAG: hypothetical protein D3904_03400 [Candidatus Electrothrix sp. EH2]|nr:hypothetical protein [Candidatus Electrothrix sp. EH2]
MKIYKTGCRAAGKVPKKCQLIRISTRLRSVKGCVEFLHIRLPTRCSGRGSFFFSETAKNSGY